MAEIGLQGSSIDALIGQRVAAGMPEHVRMDLEPDLDFVAGAREQLGEARRVNGPPPFEENTNGEADWRFSSRNAGLIPVAEGASIRLRRCGVVTGAWGTTERRQLALSSAELHHGATRAKRLFASAEVIGRTVWLGKPRGVHTGAQTFHRKGSRRRNGPSADGVRDRHGEQGDRRATQVCRPNHRDPRLAERGTLGLFVWPQ